MDTPRDPSRRHLLSTGGAGVLMAVLAGCKFGSPGAVPGPAAILTVGDVDVAGVVIKPVSMGTPNVAMDKGLCKLLSGGINFKATVDLQPRAGATPAWWGELLLLQQVQFHHEHTVPKLNGLRCTASSGGGWNLDGQDPYQNKRAPCGPGPTSISHADDPGAFTEDRDSKKGPFEEVDVMPLDRFRTYLIWETTDDSRPPSATNATRRHVLARVDWQWNAVALPPSGSPQCRSALYAPNAWSPMNATSDVKVYVGKAALADPQLTGRPITPPPNAKLPPAAPEAWRPAPC